jgi:hypothetical protein
MVEPSQKKSDVYQPLTLAAMAPAAVSWVSKERSDVILRPSGLALSMEIAAVSVTLGVKPLQKKVDIAQAAVLEHLANELEAALSIVELDMGGCSASAGIDLDILDRIASFIS